MTRIFVVSHSDYDDTKIFGVFETKEFALSYIEDIIRSKNRKNIGKETLKDKMSFYDIDEFELNTFNRIDYEWDWNNKCLKEEKICVNH